MTVRAKWGLGVADLKPDMDDDSDPFDSTTIGQGVLTAASSPEEFAAALVRLNKRAEQLFAMGVTCPLREAGECHCASCPISQINDLDGERHQLCKQGVAEERTVMLARVAGMPSEAR